jgi:hypothetical protein
MKTLTNLTIELKNEITDIIDYSYAKMSGWCEADLAPLKVLSKKGNEILKNEGVYLNCGKLQYRNF